MQHICIEFKSAITGRPNKARDGEQPGRPPRGAGFPSSSQDKTFQGKAEETQHRQLQSTRSPEVCSSLIQSGFWLSRTLEFLVHLLFLFLNVCVVISCINVTMISSSY